MIGLIVNPIYNDCYIIAGLGNIGLKYRKTRHNVGFMAADVLINELKKAGKLKDKLSTRVFGALWGIPSIIVKPRTLMNRSGLALRQLIEDGACLEKLIVMHDDLDIPFGQLRIKKGGGSGGHKGIRSIIQELGGDDFVRIRIGISKPDNSADTIQYVLGSFDKQQKQVLTDILEMVKDAARTIINQGCQRAMNTFNRRDVELVSNG